ncbi:hypothetical protein Q3G72_022860 [Acer saccharum]|nr:hypothetical protein Q3G72_022860 [Acer saccharum]
MLETEQKLVLHNGDLESGNIAVMGDIVRVEDGGDVNSPMADIVVFKDDTNLEPLSGMEFDSHGEAYSFYQEYARSMGFNTAIQNSRRSKTSREFIDAKFACSRYGTKREYDKSYNRPRARQSKQEQDNATGRRSCAKTDCKASMHVKRRPDGKWVIHSFVKEHNHELLPAQAVSEQTRKMYAAMAKQFAEYKNVVGLKNDPKNPFDKGRNLTLEAGDVKILLDFFMQMQNMNANFFYAIDVGEDQRLKNLFWVDAKSRHDYSNFCDVVSFDTTYVRNKYKMPLALFIGVNQHYQFMLLGCAMISDESAMTFSWLMQTWMKAMGGQGPKVIITDQDKAMKSVVSEVFPDARHCFCLWHVLGKISENLGHLIKQHENFMAKFEKCIYRSWTEEEFSRRWWKLLDRFELREDEWMLSLHEDRKQWVPTYMRDTFLAGMSTEALGNCLSVNTSNKSLVEAVTSPTHGLICIEEDNQNRNMNKTSKRKNPTKKRKVNSEQEVMTVGPQDSLQQMDKISSRAVNLDGYYGTPQSVQGMVQLNLMAPTRDNYYGNQQTIQGLGQLNSIAPSHDGYYSTQQGMHGLGQMDFFRTPAGFTYNIRDDPNRSAVKEPGKDVRKEG